MSYDPDETIAAVASNDAGAARGIVRISGPDTAECLRSCFVPCDGAPLSAGGAALRIVGGIRVQGDDRRPGLVAPGSLLLWPGERSYTRQPAAEFHTLGSPPVMSAVLAELCRHGARPAQPGEFTLRAFLAGRVDLTQAEAVLGVVDARAADDLAGALVQLAGGLSGPLNGVREDLLTLLAELEAGLDFAEEDIEFISRDELRRRLAAGRDVVAAATAQIRERDRRGELPRVALAGQPNVGKSRLFNALAERYGVAATESAIVSSMPGSTRDYLTATLDLDGVRCELIDAAGEESASAEELGRLSQERAQAERSRADLRLRCVEFSDSSGVRAGGAGELVALTKCDLARGELEHAGDMPEGVVPCSGATGRGVEELADRLRGRVMEIARESGGAAFAAATAARCAGSLREADRALEAAWNLSAGHEELVAAEVRAALGALGEVVGKVCADEVLDRVFRQFCIGK
jgi:tRNA modification GTPase